MHLPLKKIFSCLLCCLGILLLISFAHTVEVSSQTVRISVVKSSDRTEYEQTTNEIKSSLHQSSLSCNFSEVLLYSSTEDETVFWRNLLRENRPDLVIPVGTSATQSAIKNVQEVPIVFTMVLDDFESIQLKISSSKKDINGVSLAIPVQEQFDILLEAMPFIKRIGLIYSTQPSQLYYTARKITTAMNLQLVTFEISNERNFPGALREILPEIDILWMPPDAIIYNNPNILRYVLRESFTNSVPTMAVSKHLAVAGAPLALGVDYEDIGKQTADLVLKRLSHNYISTPVVETPRRVILYINRRVLSSLGITIPGRVLEKAVPVESE